MVILLEDTKRGFLSSYLSWLAIPERLRKPGSEAPLVGQGVFAPGDHIAPGPRHGAAGYGFRVAVEVPKAP
jgi:hypothetical protein